MILLVLSISFIVFPAFISVYQLHKAINKWRRNEELAVWIGDNVKPLYMLSVITANSFVAVDICSSCMFNFNLSQMPIDKTELLKFKTKKVYSIMLFEVCNMSKTILFH